MTEKRIALVCDWLTNLGGAEKVIMVLHEMFPKAPIFTTLYDPKRVSGFEDADIRPSYLQKIPFAKTHHQMFLSWMPQAVEAMDLDQYDIVISSSHSVAKGIITNPETVHICYCHTPMRYAWEPWELESRLRSFPSFMHGFIRRKMHNIRMWDRVTAERVDHFIANSQFVADRIRKYYRKPSHVIYPPVNTDDFSIRRPKDYYLMVGRLIPYKRHDLVIEAFNRLKKPLKVVGVGTEESRLSRRAGKTIEFLGPVPDNDLRQLYSECRALIFPQIEDFGVTAVECMASGRPVIAYQKGGALETVVNGETGIFFDSQTVESLITAITSSESITWHPEKIKIHAEKFSKQKFEKAMRDFISSKIL